MSLEKNKCGVVNKTKLNEEQILVETKLDTSDLEDFQKICWIDANVEIENVDVLNKEVNFSGKVYFDVVYLNSNNNFCHSELNTPFMNKISNEKVEANSKIDLSCNIESVKFNDKMQKIEIIIAILPIMCLCSENEIIGNGNEDLITKSDEIASQSLVINGCVEFNEEISEKIGESFDKILSVKSKAITKSIDAGTNMFTIQGEIVSTIHYTTTDDELEKIKYITLTEPFKREIEANGTTENSFIDVTVLVKKENYKYEMNPENNEIQINVPIVVCFKVFDEMMIPCATDIFSLTKKLDIVKSSIQKTNLFSLGFIEGKIEASLNLDENEPRIDKVLGISECLCQISNSSLQDEQLVIEGLANFNLTYLNDENQNIYTTQKAFPFSVKKTIENQNDNKIFVDAILSDVEIVARRGREILVDGKIKAYVNACETLQEEVLTDAIILNEYQAKRHAIEIYFGKEGDDIWDIAKELRVKPETIASQNPDIILPLENNQNIVVYNQKVE